MAKFSVPILKKVCTLPIRMIHRAIYNRSHCNNNNFNTILNNYNNNKYNLILSNRKNQ